MQIRSCLYLSFFILVALNSCNTLKNPFQGKRSPHEKYGDGLSNAGLKQTFLGSQWFSVANKALQQPQPVTLPYKETGFFPAEKPSSAGYTFTASRGENIMITISTKPTDSILLFTELWQSSAKPVLLTVMDTLSNVIKYTVKKEGKFIVRIQPELLRSLEYTIIINTGPSLAFPVERSGNPKIISVWGAGRDNGTRKHEGVDISANFRTPAIAAINGITRVTENNLGGKVVFLDDETTGNSLYYAHLDSQIVHTGQSVKTGDVVGLVGKTGNAQHTIPHLHFGIYTMGGAIDPLAFIDPRIKQPKPITASLQKLNKWIRTTTATNVYESAATKSNIAGTVLKGDALLVIAAADDYYKIQLPNGFTGFIKSDLVTDKILREHKVASGTKLLDEPGVNAPAKTIIGINHSFDVLGTYQDFYLVKDDNFQGWISQ